MHSQRGRLRRPYFLEYPVNHAPNSIHTRIHTYIHTYSLTLHIHHDFLVLRHAYPSRSPESQSQETPAVWNLADPCHASCCYNQDPRKGREKGVGGGGAKEDLMNGSEKVSRRKIYGSKGLLVVIISSTKYIELR